MNIFSYIPCRTQVFNNVCLNPFSDRANLDPSFVLGIHGAKNLEPGPESGFLQRFYSLDVVEDPFVCDEPGDEQERKGFVPAERRRLESFKVNPGAG